MSSVRGGGADSHPHPDGTHRKDLWHSHTHYERLSQNRRIQRDCGLGLQKGQIWAGNVASTLGSYGSTSSGKAPHDLLGFNGSLAHTWYEKGEKIYTDCKATIPCPQIHLSISKPVRKKEDLLQVQLFFWNNTMITSKSATSGGVQIVPQLASRCHEKNTMKKIARFGGVDFAKPRWN
jgi:hypothetical protein